MAKSDVLVRMKADIQGYDANIAKARRQLDQFKKDNLSMGGVLKQLNGSLLATATRFASVGAAIGALGAAFESNIETAKNFEKSMSQLSSLTGMVGDDLGKLKEYAIELGSSTTLSASQVADAFKMIGSQQPQLLASGEALKAVTKNAITLAEAAGIDLATASQTLSTSINQMGGDSANAERYINVLAAASQKGAGDIAWLGEAITKSGTTAKAVGTDYEELVANLEQLAKAGFDASTAGTALRSIIMNLEKQANNDFKPSVVGLTQAFENLGKANLDIVGYQEIAGKMFASQAKALADAAGEAKNMTTAITGTNTAEEQAKTNTDNLEGSIKALSSAWEGFNLHLNSSNGLFRDIVDGLKDIVVWADNVIVKLGEIPNPENIITNSLQEVGSNVDDNGNYIKRPAQKGAAGFDWESGTWKPGYTGAIYNGATGQTELPEITVAGTKRTKTGSGGGSDKNKKTKQELTELQENQKKINDLVQEYIKLGDQSTESAQKRQEEIQKEIQMLKERNGLLGLRSEQAQGRMLLKTSDVDMSQRFNGGSLLANPFGSDTKAMKTDGLKLTLDNKAMKSVTQGIEKSLPKVLTKEQKIEGMQNLLGGVGGMLSGIQQIGIEIPEEIQSVMGVLNGIMTVVTSIESIIITGQFLGLFAHGGIVPHAANGYFVPGNNFSGDTTPILANAGELVLNRFQQQALAANIQNKGGGDMQVVGKIRGEEIVLVANRYFKRTGQGEILTW